MSKEANTSVWTNPRSWANSTIVACLSVGAKLATEKKLGEWSWASFGIVFALTSEYLSKIWEKEVNLEKENIELKKEISSYKEINYHTNHVERLKSEAPAQSMKL